MQDACQDHRFARKWRHYTVYYDNDTFFIRKSVSRTVRQQRLDGPGWEYDTVIRYLKVIATNAAIDCGSPWRGKRLFADFEALVVGSDRDDLALLERYLDETVTLRLGKIPEDSRLLGGAGHVGALRRSEDGFHLVHCHADLDLSMIITSDARAFSTAGRADRDQ